MPEEWNQKDERQYEEIRKDQMQRGTDEERAEEIAARTVNQRRRKEGRTENETTSGTGNPNTRLEDRTKEELDQRAQELDIEGRSKMDKDELISAIRQRQ